MPITNPLQNAQRPNHQDLKDFIRAENERLRAELKAEFAAVRAEFKADLAGLRAEMHSALREQSMRFVTIVFGLVAVAIIKLFPNLF